MTPRLTRLSPWHGRGGADRPSRSCLPTVPRARFGPSPRGRAVAFTPVRARLTAAVAAMMMLLTAAGPRAQTTSATDLKGFVDELGSLEYPVRMNAARRIRRVPAGDAVTALVEAVRKHQDQFVRYRALVLLTGFSERRTGELVREVLRDRNDRLREVAYKWLERNPDPAMAPTLLAALQTEEAEFVRPALVGALAALGSNPQVQRALIAESNRGLDFFRSAVIDALGRHRATFAVGSLVGMAGIDGPLRDDVVLALGRIGDPRAGAVVSGLLASPGNVMPMARAAQCLLGKDCATQIGALVDAAPSARSFDAVRQVVEAVTAVADAGNDAATDALVDLAAGAAPLRDAAAVGLATVAVRRPEHVLAWLGSRPQPARTTAIDLLKEGFESLEEDFGEEQFFAAARAAYWKLPEESSSRSWINGLIDRLEF